MPRWEGGIGHDAVFTPQKLANPTNQPFVLELYQMEDFLPSLYGWLLSVPLSKKPESIL
jgi:hypothetical protein